PNVETVDEVVEGRHDASPIKRDAMRGHPMPLTYRRRESSIVSGSLDFTLYRSALAPLYQRLGLSVQGFVNQPVLPRSFVVLRLLRADLLGLVEPFLGFFFAPQSSCGQRHQQPIPGHRLGARRLHYLLQFFLSCIELSVPVQQQRQLSPMVGRLRMLRG